MSTDISLYLASLREVIDKELDGILSRADHPVINIQESMRYSVMAGGKRLRPILCISACEALGGQLSKILPIACAIEMVHTYSLIHDDLPSMDDDSLRRGQPTNHTVYGEATAILAGDGLLTDAFSLIAQEGINRGVSDGVVIKVISTLAGAIGSGGMIKGQALDLAIEGRDDIELGELEQMHALKTGALIEASVAIGGYVAGGGDRQIEKLKNYGRSVGLAFQIIDDVIDEEGGARTGKLKGADKRKNKVTYTQLMGVEQSRQSAKALTERAISEIEFLNSSAPRLREIAIYLGDRDH